MNKNVAGILSAAAVLTMLAGCTAYDRTKDQFTASGKDVKRHDAFPGCSHCR